MKKKTELNELEDYEACMNELKKKLQSAEEEYMKQANALTMEREKAAIPFVEEIKKD